MSETRTLLALFEDVEPAAQAIEKLEALGLTHEQVNVISGVPVMEHILGRPSQWTNVPRLALGGAAAGFLTGDGCCVTSVNNAVSLQTSFRRIMDEVNNLTIMTIGGQV